MIKWRRCCLANFRYDGGGGWTEVYVEEQVELVTAEISAGHLMMRAHRGRTESGVEVGSSTADPLRVVSFA